MLLLSIFDNITPGVSDMRAFRTCAVTFGLVALFLGAASQRTSTTAASPRESMLTPVSWLAQHLHDPNLVVLQVGETDTYKKEHIPGAQAADMTAFVAPMDHSANAPASQLMIELPTDYSLRTTLQGFGISDNSHTVIVESDNWHSPSTRIYLTLVHAGLGANTSLLDGGLPAWKAAGQSTTADVPVVKPGTLSPLRTVPVTVNAEYVQAHVKAADVALLDVRSPAAWSGVENSGT